LVGLTTTGASHGKRSLHDDHSRPWNKGKLVGQKAPFKLKEIWAIRVRLQLANGRDLASGMTVAAEQDRLWFVA
jgi:hypothetical protein